MFSCEYCKIFKNSFFIEHLWGPIVCTLPPLFLLELSLRPNFQKEGVDRVLIFREGLLEKGKVTFLH